MVAAASTNARPLPDISAETTGKLERLIIELARRPALVVAELWQNRNNPTLNADYVGEHVRLSFILSNAEG